MAMEMEQPVDLSYIVDPFRMESGIRERIDLLYEALSGPWTMVGERLVQDQLENTVFQVYDRTMPVFVALVTLIEFDEIERYFRGDFFRKGENQRLVVKALALKVEESMTELSFEGERKGYYDYQNYYQGLIRQLKALDDQVRQGTSYPNIINSLTMIYSNNMKKLRGTSSFNINVDLIRKRIADYIPALQRHDDGLTTEVIRNKFQSAVKQG